MEEVVLFGGEIVDIQYSPEVRQWAEGSTLIEQASTLLVHAVGPKRSQQVSGEWIKVRDHLGQTLYRLTIRDSTGEASTDFAPSELRNPLQMKYRIYTLWDDVLKIHSDLQHERVLRLSSELAASPEGD